MLREHVESLRVILSELKCYESSKAIEYDDVNCNFYPEELRGAFMYSTDNPQKLIKILLQGEESIEIPVWALNKRDFFTLLNWVTRKVHSNRPVSGFKA